MEVKDSSMRDFQTDQGGVWLSGREAMLYLGFINPQSVRNLRLDGKINGRRKENGHWEYERGSLEEYRLHRDQTRTAA